MPLHPEVRRVGEGTLPQLRGITVLRLRYEAGSGSRRVIQETTLKCAWQEAIHADRRRVVCELGVAFRLMAGFAIIAINL